MKRLLSTALLALALTGPSTFAQDEPPLGRLARDAGLIFTGAVEKIEPVAPALPGDIGVVRVTFRVHDALRGATAGEALTISEWDRLWIARDRYRVGESVLLFLYPPSRDLGLTTTVGGEQGHISLAGSQLSLASIASEIAETRADPPSASNKPRRLPKLTRGQAAVE